MHRSRSAITILLLVLLLSAGQAIAAGPKRVLFIGNSLTYSNRLPQIVQAMAKAQGDDLYVETVAFGGFDLELHWNQGSALQAIKQGWDVVILQQGPSSLASSRVHIRSWTKRFAPEIRRAGARPALYMVWPELDRIDVFDDVRDSYSLAASDVRGMFIPAGEVWRAAWRREPSAPLYGSDNFHPTVAGSYAAALSIYGMLFNRPPQGLPARLELASGDVVEVPESLARTLAGRGDGSEPDVRPARARNGLVALGPPVRQHEHLPRQIRRQSLLAVVDVEHRRFPGEEIRVPSFELVPGLVAVPPGHALVDQEEVRPGDGLVVETRLPVARGKGLQSFREAGQRGQRRFRLEVEPRKAYMVTVMQPRLRQRPVLESLNQFVGHIVFSAQKN